MTEPRTMADLRRWLHSRRLSAAIQRRSGIWIATLWRGRRGAASQAVSASGSSPMAALKLAMRAWG